MVFSDSVYADALAYDGSVYALAALETGRNTSPEMRPLVSNANWTSMVARSNAQAVITISLSAIFATRGSASQLLNAPA
jgi:hypothetical protein